MKLWKLVRIMISLIFLTGSSYQASSTINLLDSVNQSGRHSVCLNEDVVYSCSSYTNSLTWNIYLTNDGYSDTAIFTANDRLQLSRLLGQAVAILLNNIPNNLTSQLVIPYTPSWNGLKIECMSETNVSENLSYVIADMPLSPTSIWHTISTPEQFLTLQWSLMCDTGVDCSSIKIVINGTNPLNVSYPTSLAILNISKYLSEDSVEIEIYTVNKCNMVSTSSASSTVNIGNSTQGVTTETCHDKFYYFLIGVGGVMLLIGLVLGAIIHKYLCISRKTSVSDTN